MASGGGEGSLTSRRDTHDATRTTGSHVVLAPNPKPHPAPPLQNETTPNITATETKTTPNTAAPRWYLAERADAAVLGDGRVADLVAVLAARPLVPAAGREERALAQAASWCERRVVFVGVTLSGEAAEIVFTPQGATSSFALA